MYGYVAFFAFGGLWTVGMCQSLASAQDCVNDATNRQCWNGPWGNFDINTDYYQNTPDTGEIVEVILWLSFY